MQTATGKDPGARADDLVDRLQRIIQTQSVIVQADFDLDRFMQLVVDTAAELTGARGAVVELLEGDGKAIRYRSASGALADYVGLVLDSSSSLSGACVRERRVLRCDDVELDGRVDIVACRRVGVRSMLCTPLIQGGHAIGVLKVMSDQPAAFDEGDVQMLDLMAGALAAALGKQLAFDARVHAEDRLRASEARMRAMLEHAHEAVVSIDKEGRVTLWNRSAERLLGWEPAEALGRPLADLVVPPELRQDFERVLASVALRGDPDELPDRVAVPAVDRAGRVLSVELSLSATHVDGRFELTAFGHDVSRRRELESQLREMALCDGLTGLANRRSFMDTLEKAVSRARRLGHPAALLFLDLDGFKAINDRHGHHVGDLALQVFARRLEKCVRKGDTVARLGGDEFTVLAEGVATIAQARALADKIVEAMRPPLEMHGLVLRTSIGVCLYRAGADASQFLRDADRAMYLAKGNGNGGGGAASCISIESVVE